MIQTSAMSRRDLIAALETQADEIRVDAENRMTTLLDAARELRALDGKLAGPDTPAPPDKPSISSLVLAVFTDAPNKVFDAAQLRQMLLDATPQADDAEKKRIKNGTYQALQILSDKKKIRRAPGGYELMPPQAPAPENV